MALAFLQPKKKDEENLLRTIFSIQSMIKFSKIRNLILEGRIVIFKTLALPWMALPKIVLQSLINIIPNHIISELISIQKTLYGITQVQK